MNFKVLILILISSNILFGEYIDKKKILDIIKHSKNKSHKIKTTEKETFRKSNTNSVSTINKTTIQYGSLPNIPPSSKILQQKFTKDIVYRRKNKIKKIQIKKNHKNPIARQIKFY